MERLENLGITAIVTKKKIKIEVTIAGAVNAFHLSPNNYSEVKLKRGKRAEFAEYLVRALIDNENPETGDSPVMEMFDSIFESILEGAEEFCIYPDE